VSEEFDVRVGGGEGETFGEDTDGAYGIPNCKNLDIDVDRERPFE